MIRAHAKTFPLAILIGVLVFSAMALGGAPRAHAAPTVSDLMGVPTGQSFNGVPSVNDLMSLPGSYQGSGSGGVPTVSDLMNIPLDVPFGGMIVAVFPCVDGTFLVQIAGPFPGKFVFDPKKTILHPFGNILSTNFLSIGGVDSSGGDCKTPAGKTISSDGTMLFTGTSM